MESLRRHLVGGMFLAILLLAGGLILYRYHDGNLSWKTIFKMGAKVSESDIVGSWKYVKGTSIKNFFLLGNERIDFMLNTRSGEHVFKTYFNGNPIEGGTWQIDSSGVLTLSFNGVLEDEYATEYSFNRVRATVNTLTLENTTSGTVFTYAYAPEE